MSPFFRLICTFEVLTPLYLGGASQQAELRVPSIKGAMRFWYRALDPDFRKREPVLLGSGGKDAAQSLLRVRCWPGEKAHDLMRWRDARTEQFDQESGRLTRNGLAYLGYPFGMKSNDERTAIRPSARFSVEVSCHRPCPEGVSGGVTPLRAALASMWALAHFGALGTRARRGFGAVTLIDWRVEDRDGQTLHEARDLAELPLLHRSTSPADWIRSAELGLGILQRWFGTFEGRAEPVRASGGQRDGKRGRGETAARVRHPHFGPRAAFTVSQERVRRDDWRSALLALGRALQSFRQRKKPDYELVKDHVLSTLGEGGRRIQRAPDRTTFGLPLTFRYGSVPHGKPVTFAPVDGERHGSLLFLRPVLVGDGLFSLFLRLDGDVPGIETPVGLRGTGRSLDAASHNALDEFMREVKGQADR